MLDPVVTQFSQDWNGKVKVVKLDVDDNSDLAVQYGVMSVPTLILFVDGKPGTEDEWLSAQGPHYLEIWLFHLVSNSTILHLNKADLGLPCFFNPLVR